MKKAIQPEQHQLWDLFDYAPLEGVLMWRTGRRSGMPAGCLNGRRRRVVSIGDIIHSHYRLLWVWFYGKIEEGLTIDHINGNTADDRIWNLRLATPSQQQLNRSRCNSKYGLPKGVTMLNGKYKAHIGAGGSGNSIHLGMFDSPEEAHAAYCAAARLKYDTAFWRAS
jgi:hypothetical protein